MLLEEPKEKQKIAKGLYISEDNIWTSGFFIISLGKNKDCLRDEVAFQVLPLKMVAMEKSRENEVRLMSSWLILSMLPPSFLLFHCRSSHSV